MRTLGIVTAIAVAGLAGSSAKAVTPKNHYMIGMIDCIVRGVGTGGGDHLHDVSCEFAPGQAEAETYFGVVETVKNGRAAAAGTPMQWLVFAARRDTGAGILSGDYDRAKETLGFGFDAEALVREKGPLVILQPVAGRHNASHKAAIDAVRLELRSLSD
ncbi:MAG: DUF992 domain-containing protein [Hyphomicrobiales bacterium]|nr:DUF992 domain-containing protein [Hyphomicrobiales bacterium]